MTKINASFFVPMNYIGKRRHHESSNRTFMELKYRMRHFSATEGVCSNRTFMELKLGTWQG